ncbi:hypothetical protein GCM10023116_22860 [Kistimonas scapharcae]|uniref:Uncharacterized protein n=1 Tax=Kistimonas scapharcae TaxID=1036133 RepID=A0ABP8V3G7_9GAMM
MISIDTSLCIVIILEKTLLAYEGDDNGCFVRIQSDKQGAIFTHRWPPIIFSGLPDAALVKASPRILRRPALTGQRESLCLGGSSWLGDTPNYF